MTSVSSAVRSPAFSSSHPRALVELRAQPLRNSPVDDVADEQVPEEEGRLTSQDGRLDKALVRERIERSRQSFQLARSGQGFDRLEAEDLPLDRRALHHLPLNLVEQVEPAFDERLERRRQWKDQFVGGRDPAAVAPAQHAGVDQHGEELLEEEGIPAGRLDHMVARSPASPAPSFRSISAAEASAGSGSSAGRRSRHDRPARAGWGARAERAREEQRAPRSRPAPRRVRGTSAPPTAGRRGGR